MYLKIMIINIWKQNFSIFVSYNDIFYFLMVILDLISIHLIIPFNSFIPSFLSINESQVLFPAAPVLWDKFFFYHEDAYLLCFPKFIQFVFYHLYNYLFSFKIFQALHYSFNNLDKKIANANQYFTLFN